MTVRDSFGKPKESGGTVFMKVGEDETRQFRIFPPKGKLASKGIWAVYLQQHYGYGVPDPKDASKTRIRPFLCVEEKDGDRVVVSCPECRKIEEFKRLHKEKFEAEVVRLVTEKLTRTEAEAQAGKLVETITNWLSTHNLDRKWYMVAMGEDGQVGYLVIPHKAKKMLDTKKKALAAEEKIDILDLDAGAWIQITRSGRGRETEYETTIAQELVVTTGGTKAKVTKVSGFTDQQCQQALDLADLDSDIIRKITREQIKMLVEGSGAPEEVEAILNLGQRHEVKREEHTYTQAPSVDAHAAAIVAPGGPMPGITQHTYVPSVLPVDAHAAAIAALQAQLAALQAAPKPALVQTPPPLSSEAVKALSDEEFLAKFGPKP